MGGRPAGWPPLSAVVARASGFLCPERIGGGVEMLSVGFPWTLFLPMATAAAIISAGIPGGPWRWVAVGIAAALGFAIDVWAGRQAAPRRD